MIRVAKGRAMKQPVERRLAAILAADVAGYSRLMGADEEGTHQHLRAHLREVVDPKTKEHRGRVVKNTGDGMLVEFADWAFVEVARFLHETERPSRPVFLNAAMPGPEEDRDERVREVMIKLSSRPMPAREPTAMSFC
jgi:class 3 adenylate cyclase